MEATENDIPPTAGFRVSGFPTIKFKKAGTKEFIDYNGDRSLEDMISFVEENSANDLKVKAASNDTPVAEQPTAQEPLKVAEESRHEEL